MAFLATGIISAYEGSLYQSIPYSVICFLPFPPFMCRMLPINYLFNLHPYFPWMWKVTFTLLMIIRLILQNSGIYYCNFCWIGTFSLCCCIGPLEALGNKKSVTKDMFLFLSQALIICLCDPEQITSTIWISVLFY